MREALAEALSDFDGAIVMVSHDRHLIGLVSDQYWRVHDGIVEPFEGDLDDYAAWLRSRPGSDNPKTPAPKAATVVAAPVPAASKAKPNPHRLQKAEERVARLEGKLAECEAQMADPALYADAGKVADLGRQQMQLRAELEQAEGELLALYD
jgi:ATP-binding cassette subfamily F protein 3